MASRPSFTLLAILNLALGIGAATTIFSVIQNVLLDPFPYADARRVAMIQIHDTTSSRPGGRSFFQVPEFLELESQNHVFEDVIGGTNEDVLMTTPEGTEQFTGGATTPNMFQVLAVPAQLGRTLTPADAATGAPPVFVMSYKIWVSRYNRDASVLGRTYVLNGVPTTLVGVMPQRFTKLGADLWRPVVLNRADPAVNQQFFMFQAKLKPGVTLQQAAADADIITHRLAKLYPANYPQQFTAVAVSWVDNIVGPFRATLYTLAAAVGLLLLIACSNVANMLLARAASREKEMAIRASMGASRSRLIRQLLVESLMLATAGVVIGCLFSYVGIQALVQLIPDGLIPREAIIRLDLPVLAFSVATAAMTAVLFGLLPAFQTAKRDIVEPLKDSGKGVSGGFRGGKLRGALVIVEVALSLMLLAGAGLLMRSFVKLQTVDLGMNPNNVLVARLPLPRGQYTTAPEKQRFFRELLRRLHEVPGIEVATTASSLPPYGGIGSDIEIPGKTSTEKWNAIFQLASEGYFQTLGLRLQRGRPLSESDVNGARRVAVVNQTLVNRYFGHEDPIGRQIRFKLLETDQPIENPVFEIIGVVSDAKNQGIQDPTMPEAFIPYTVTGAVRTRDHGENAWRSRGAHRSRQAGGVGCRSRRRDHADRFADRIPHAVLVRDAQVQRRSPRCLCVCGSGARGDRCLQRDRLHRVAADARDRDSHGARRGAGARPPNGRVHGPAPRCRGRSDWPACEFCGDAPDRRGVVCHVATRSADAHRCRGDNRPGRSRGVLLSGTPGHEGRSA